MKNQLKKHFPFFLVYLIFLLVTVYVLYFFPKTTIHLFINSYHTPIADFVFKYITYLGDGFAIVAVSLILLFYSKRNLLVVILSGAISGIIAQFLKKIVFGPLARPSQFFSELNQELYFVPGVDLHTVFSFPSGHSTSVFALATSLVLIQKNRSFDIPLISAAIVVAFSRIYLSQHFLIDVLAGSLIGVSVALLVYSVLNSRQFTSRKGLDKSLINFDTKRF